MTTVLPGRSGRCPTHAALLVLGVAATALAQSTPSTQTAPSAAAPAPAPGGATATARTFTAPAGLLFNTVRPERAADFEKVVGYVHAALASSTDANDRAQAQGWRVFKAAEPGPGGTLLYVFMLDPAVPGADYGFGRVLAQAYPDPAQLQEIWKLYTGAVTSGGTLLNLTPVTPGQITAPAAPATSPSAPATERPLPPDADPNRR